MSEPSRASTRRPRPARPMRLLTLLALVGCGPAPGYVEEPSVDEPGPAPSAFPPEDQNSACRQASTLQRIQGRMSRGSSVEGMGTLACPPVGNTIR